MPRVQFAARNHAAFLSFPLAAAAFASVLWPSGCALCARKRDAPILAFLALGAFGRHGLGIRDLSNCIQTFRQVLGRYLGFLAAEPLLATLPTPQCEPWLRRAGGGRHPRSAF